MENEQVAQQQEEEQVVEQMATEEAEAATEEVAQEVEAKQEATEEVAQEQPAEQETNGEGDAPKEVKEGDLIKASTDNELKLFIGGLPRDTTSTHMKEYFSTFGKVSWFK